MGEEPVEEPKRGTVAGGNEVAGSDYGYACCWCLLLCFVAWPLALICAILWVLVQPFESCMDGAEGANRCLYPFLRYPRRVGRAIYRCDKEMPKPVAMPDNAGGGGGGRPSNSGGGGGGSSQPPVAGRDEEDPY